MVDAKTLKYVNRVKHNREITRSVMMLLPILAIAIAIAVFWWLKLTGITMTSEACCGLEEHTHTAECFTDSYTCKEAEHTHTPSCYSNLKADLETRETWESTFSHLSDELSPADKAAEIAKTQLGYKESSLNFVADENGVRRGYTRYGEWYGNPYGDWSAMFVSFCLRYGGFGDAPINSGAEAMRLQWEESDMLLSAEEHTPIPGNTVFLDKNLNSQADAVAIVTAVSSDSITVIEGDVDGEVAEVTYSKAGGEIISSGITAPERLPVITLGVLQSSPRVKVGNAAVQSHSLLTSSGARFVIYTQGNDGNYYAINGNGDAVRVYVESDGSITCDEDRGDIWWTFTSQGTYDGQNAYYIQNTQTGLYFHPHVDDYTRELLSVLSGRWETAVYPWGNGFKLRGARQDAYSQLQNNSSFKAVTSRDAGSILYIATALPSYNVWLDGTCGGLMSLGGSPDVHYSVREGSAFTLPSSWQPPDKYDYKLRGWYDITNGKYYAPGDTVNVTGNSVFYADWVAASYDIGQFNADALDTPSTSEFVTVRMFDYGVLFNLYSTSVSSSISATSHTETWSLITSGNSPFTGSSTLDFILRDWDRGNEDISYPQNHNDKNNPTDAGTVYSGLYTDLLGDLLFNPDNSMNPETGQGVLGKEFLGYGDHLFNYMNDPASDRYGYFYYDSNLNAASYNQSEGRFYVYDYLEKTSDSPSTSSDFLPLNSPYANTNGKNVNTYNFNGVNGEYNGVDHYVFDAKYNTDGNSSSNAGTNYWFGMSIDIRFYLPNAPGEIVDGQTGNRDVYGKEMHFEFSGDDDVWVFVDGELVLDIGGIHGIESGDINFSTGIVTVNGEQTNTIYHIPSGEHTLTIYYMERGSSLSHCSIYFNMAPRYNLNIRKEDVLTAEYLNGAEFSVFTDSACTIPAQLWNSEAEYKNGIPPTNVFTVIDGEANIWGLGAGNTYYLKETSPPTKEDYSVSHGIICFKLDKTGAITYDVEILDDALGDPSKGFTVHGFKIDEENRQAYIVVTNAKDYVTETTEVSVKKVWEDSKDHSGDTVTVYLTVTDPDGTVRRIREAVLGEGNGWNYTFKGLQKYLEDGTTPIEYRVEEAHVPGYIAKVEKTEAVISGGTGLASSPTLEAGKTYLLLSPAGYLAAINDSQDSMLHFIGEEEAKNSPLARWHVSAASSDTFYLTNEAGQILSFNYGGTTDSFFRAKTASDSRQPMKFTAVSGGVKICHHINEQYWLNEKFFISNSFNSYGGLKSTSEANALVFTPMTETTIETPVDSDSFFYKITNSVLDPANTTSLTVYKTWDTGMTDGLDYERFRVTVKLLANGVDAGRTVTLSIRNNWRDTFLGLPYRDSEGNVIKYTVEEVWGHEDWIPHYGEIAEVAGDPPTYSTTLENSYRWGRGTLLPETGGMGIYLWIFGGIGIMTVSLTSAYVMRRKRERRLK